MINNQTEQPQAAAERDDDFEQMMRQRIQSNFGTPAESGLDVTDERLREMNKKLPDWSLEPPYSFIR